MRSSSPKWLAQQKEKGEAWWPMILELAAGS
jgi:hypothetical protein